MAYEKPELLVLSFARKAIKSSDNSNDTTANKGSHIEEGGGAGDGMDNTSSTSSAYEADE